MNTLKTIVCLSRPQCEYPWILRNTRFAMNIHCSIPRPIMPTDLPLLPWLAPRGPCAPCAPCALCASCDLCAHCALCVYLKRPVSGWRTLFSKNIVIYIYFLLSNTSRIKYIHHGYKNKIIKHKIIGKNTGKNTDEQEQMEQYTTRIHTYIYTGTAMRDFVHEGKNWNEYNKKIIGTIWMETQNKNIYTRRKQFTGVLLRKPTAPLDLRGRFSSVFSRKTLFLWPRFSVYSFSELGRDSHEFWRRCCKLFPWYLVGGQQTEIWETCICI